MGLGRSEHRLIQLGLLEGGFYSENLADDLFGRNTREAIGRWQVSRDHVPTGYLDAESAQLLLEAGRGREAAMAAETFSQAISDAQNIQGTFGSATVLYRAMALAHIALAQAKAGRHQDAEQSISQAISIAQDIESDRYRVEAFAHIALAQAKAGSHQDAARSFSQAISFADDIERTDDALFVRVAEVQANAGYFSAALATARNIQTQGNREDALFLIALAQADADYVGDALATAQDIIEPDFRVEVFSRIALARAKAGVGEDAEESFSQAISILQDIESDVYRAKGFADIALAQVKAGRHQDAEQSISQAISATQNLQWVDNSVRARAFAEIALVQAKVGRHQDAERFFSLAISAAQIFETEHYLLDIVAEAQTEAGYFQAALATARMLSPWRGGARTIHMTSPFALFRIAAAQAEMGYVGDAFVTAQSIPNTDWARAAAFARIAAVQAEAD